MQLQHPIVGVSAAFALALALALPAAAADELITNGGFETGDFTGWTVADLPTSAQHSFFVYSGIGLPLSELLSVGPASGTYYAVSDMTGAGTSALLQSFTVPGPADSVVLSFEMFVNDFNQWSSGSPAIVDPIGLDHTGPANQHARVDILTSDADPFDTGAGVLAQLYIGTDPGANPSGIPYLSYEIDITPVVGAGGTYQLRYALTDNQLWLNQGVDDVSVLYTAAAVPAQVPALGSSARALLMVALIAAARPRRRRG